MNYVFFISQNLTQRNYDRLGIGILKKKKINYKIIDLSDIFDKQIYLNTKKYEKILKDKNYFKFNNFKDLFFFLKKNKENYYYSNLCSYTSFWLTIIEKYIISQGNVKVHFSVSILPLVYRKYFSDFTKMLIKMNFFKIIKAVLNFFKNRFVILINPNPSLAFISGTHEEKRFKKKTKIIYSNCLDYNLIIKLSEKVINKNYIVFLDQNATDHPDFKLSNKKDFNLVTITSKEYWIRIKDILDDLIQKNKKKAIICLHPKTSKKQMLFIKNFFSRDKKISIKTKNTLRYVAQSDTVITHTSTALQFAISLYKKIILLKFDDLVRPEHNYIIFYANHLGSNKSRNIFKGKLIMINPHKKRYSLFVKKFICACKNKPKDISWNRIFNYCKKYKKNSFSSC